MDGILNGEHNGRRYDTRHDVTIPTEEFLAAREPQRKAIETEIF
jgi:hypothetical protein